VYVKASTRNDAARDRVIARIARAAFEVFQSRDQRERLLTLPSNEA